MTTDQTLLTLKDQLLAIALDAGQAILSIYNDPKTIDVVAKADRSPLTAADRAANSAICDALEKLEIKYPIISEENKAIAYDTRRHFDRCWMVDPLDGTKEFLKRNGEFTVNIALIENGRPILGVVYAPVPDELYWGIRDAGSFYIRNGDERRLSAASFSMADNQLRVVCSRSHLNDDTRQFMDALRDPQRVSSGSSLKFLLIARGDADIYPRLAPTMEWDTAAADVILSEAGGRIEVHGTNSEMTYNKADLLNPHFVAYGRLKP